VSDYELLAGLEVEIDGYELHGRSAKVSSDFDRLSTEIVFRGAGQSGRGEDVTYDGVDQIALQDAGPVLELAGRRTLGELCELIGALDLFPVEPQRPVSRRYRRWAFESAALDLALRQAGIDLQQAVGRECRPIRFVVSLRLGEPPTLAPVERRLAITPSLEFKLDPTSSWTDELIAQLVATGAVASVDFKGHYVGSAVDQPPDADLYARVASAFSEAWIEDPALNEQTDAVLADARERFSWDAPIHCVQDIVDLPYPPRMVNIKPSRLGGLESLMAAYEYCERNAIGCYGGGQFELGVGREHIQYLASLYHPDGPNDVAPTEYNLPDPPPGLPASPLAPRPAATGFGWR
jgi:L-alanine-DL-glutamate epimerase-like enolase superfamily enzyme